MSQPVIAFRPELDLTRRSLVRLALGASVLGVPTVAPGRLVSAQPGPPGVPAVTAASVYVVDASADAPLMAVNADERRQPASTTKIVTALVVMDNAALDETVVVDAADLAAYDESAMYLAAGDTLTVEQLLQGALIPSGNDAARTLARFVGAKLPGGESGDPIARFVEGMNDYVASLGLENTHFVNAEGLDDDDQFSSARDLATIAARVMDNRTLSAIVGQLELSVTSVGPEARTYVDPATGEPLYNRNKLLEGSAEGMDGVDGVKTGTTPRGGANLIASKRSSSGNRIIAVAMGSDVEFEGGYQVSGSDRRYDDMRAILQAIEGEEVPVAPPDEE